MPPNDPQTKQTRDPLGESDLSSMRAPVVFPDLTELKAKVTAFIEDAKKDPPIEPSPETSEEIRTSFARARSGLLKYCVQALCSQDTPGTAEENLKTFRAAFQVAILQEELLLFDAILDLVSAQGVQGRDLSRRHPHLGPPGFIGVEWYAAHINKMVRNAAELTLPEVLSCDPCQGSKPQTNQSIAPPVDEFLAALVDINRMAEECGSVTKNQAVYGVAWETFGASQCLHELVRFLDPDALSKSDESGHIIAATHMRQAKSPDEVLRQILAQFLLDSDVDMSAHFRPSYLQESPRRSFHRPYQRLTLWARSLDETECENLATLGIVGLRPLIQQLRFYPITSSETRSRALHEAIKDIAGGAILSKTPEIRELALKVFGRCHGQVGPVTLSNAEFILNDSGSSSATRGAMIDLLIHQRLKASESTQPSARETKRIAEVIAAIATGPNLTWIGETRAAAVVTFIAHAAEQSPELYATFMTVISQKEWGAATAEGLRQFVAKHVVRPPNYDGAGATPDEYMKANQAGGEALKDYLTWVLENRDISIEIALSHRALGWVYSEPLSLDRLKTELKAFSSHQDAPVNSSGNPLGAQLLFLRRGKTVPRSTPTPPTASPDIRDDIDGVTAALGLAWDKNEFSAFLSANVEDRRGFIGRLAERVFSHDYFDGGGGFFNVHYQPSTRGFTELLRRCYEAHGGHVSDAVVDVLVGFIPAAILNNSNVQQAFGEECPSRDWIRRSLQHAFGPTDGESPSPRIIDLYREQKTSTQEFVLSLLGKYLAESKATPSPEAVAAFRAIVSSPIERRDTRDNSGFDTVINRIPRLMSVPVNDDEAARLSCLIPRLSDMNEVPDALYGAMAWISPPHLRSVVLKVWTEKGKATPDGIRKEFGSVAPPKADFLVRTLWAALGTTSGPCDDAGYTADYALLHRESGRPTSGDVCAFIRKVTQQKDFNTSTKVRARFVDRIGASFRDGHVPNLSDLWETLIVSKGVSDGAYQSEADYVDAIIEELLAPTGPGKSLLSDYGVAARAYPSVPKAADRWAATQHVRLAQLIGEHPAGLPQLEKKTVDVPATNQGSKRAPSTEADKIRRNVQDILVEYAPFHRFLACHPRTLAVAQTYACALLDERDRTGLEREGYPNLKLLETIAVGKPPNGVQVERDDLMRALVLPIVYDRIPFHRRRPLVAAGAADDSEKVEACREIFTQLREDMRFKSLLQALSPDARKVLEAAFNPELFCPVESAPKPGGGRRSAGNEKYQITILPASGAAMEMFGDFTRTCIEREKVLSLAYPNVSAVYFVGEEGGKQVVLGGTLLAVTETHDGKRAAVLYSFNPLDKMLKRVDAGELFESVKDWLIDQMPQLNVDYILIPKDEYSGVTLTNRSGVFNYLRDKYFTSSRSVPLRGSSDTAIAELSIRDRTILIYDRTRVN